ncbi:MAG TPA: hypothetical protein VKP08_02855, partial [Anaerolineales bacterium]|nr:hypothetical protein [Anaerolineales bacterium]
QTGTQQLEIDPVQPEIAISLPCSLLTYSLSFSPHISTFFLFVQYFERINSRQDFARLMLY